MGMRFLDGLREKPWRAALLIVLALVAVVNLATFLMWGDQAMVGTIRARLPQYVHFAEGTRFAFACVDQESWDALSPMQQAFADEILRQEFDTVYIGKESIPEDKWIYDPERPEVPAGLDGGCLLGWEFKEAPFWFWAHYSDYEGNQAASGTSAAYVWVLWRWVKVWQGPMYVS